MTLRSSLAGLWLIGLILAVGAPCAVGQDAAAPPEAEEAAEETTDASTEEAADAPEAAEETAAEEAASDNASADDAPTEASEDTEEPTLREEAKAALEEARHEVDESAADVAAHEVDGHAGDDHAHDEGAHDSHDSHGEHGDHVASEPNPLAIDPDLAVWTAIVFLILLLVLGKFAWAPIMAALEQREKSVADHISSAADKHEQAKEMLADYETKLANAANEVREMLEEARRDAEHTKSEILAEAKAAAQAEHERAMRDVRNATDAALKQIGETGANFAVELAGKIVQKELTAEDHTRLIRDAISNFPSRN